MIIDHAIEEMNQVMEFAHESFKDNDLEMTAMTLDYIDRSLNDINHLVILQQNLIDYQLMYLLQNLHFLLQFQNLELHLFQR